jgi:hypothetical protein
MDTYRGPAPESEKETKAVADFIQSHLTSIKAYITFHSYSQMLLFPYGYTSKLPPNYKDLVRKKSSLLCTLMPSLTFFCSFTWVPVKQFHIFICQKKELMKSAFKLKS